MIPGELFVADGDIELNAGRPTVTLTVANTGDRPIQVGSHYHFYETNAALRFDREKARGFRLDIPAGTATRFEPGQSREVRLVAYAGARRVVGFNGRDQRGALTWRTRSAAAPMPPCSGRPPAIASASPTPSWSSRSKATARSTARRSSSAAAR